MANQYVYGCVKGSNNSLFILAFMKKALVLAAFTLASFTATAGHAQSTSSPVPGAPDRAQQTTPTVGGNNQVTSQTRFDGQQSPNVRSQYKPERMRAAKMSMSAKKADRKEMRMQKKADKAGNM